MNIWCEVNTGTLVNNINILKNISKKKIVGVVKGNAYGLGIEKISSIIEEHVDVFGVSSTDEALKINTNKDILIMTPMCEIPRKPISNHIYTIDSAEDLDKFNGNEKYRVHIYLNTGMNRLGIKPCDFDALYNEIMSKRRNIVIEGVYTHLHKVTDIDKSKNQINALKTIFESYKDKIPEFHCLNSGGSCNNELLTKADFTTMIRCGNALYGYAGRNIGIEKVFKLKARIIKTEVSKETQYVGYGEKFTVKPNTKIGYIGCGSVDKIGFKRDIKTNVLKDGLKLLQSRVKPIPIGYFNGNPIYTICSPNMNCTLIDITNTKCNVNSEIDLNVSSIQIDSSVAKIYK